MTQTDNEKKIDFFYKEEVIQKHNGKYLAYYFQPANIQAGFKFLAHVLTVGVISLAIYTGYHIITTHKEDLQKNKQELVVQKQNIIKGVTQQDFNSFVKFIKDNKENELDRLNNLYWKIKFIDAQGEDIKKINSSLMYTKINDTQQLINKHYDNRVESFVALYSRIKMNDYNYEVTSYDDSNVEYLFKTWIDAYKQNNFFKFSDIDELESIVNQYLNDKLKLAEFMEDNKSNIEKTRALF